MSAAREPSPLAIDLQQRGDVCDEKQHRASFTLWNRLPQELKEQVLYQLLESIRRRDSLNMKQLLGLTQVSHGFGQDTFAAALRRHIRLRDARTRHSWTVADIFLRNGLEILREQAESRIQRVCTNEHSSCPGRECGSSECPCWRPYRRWIHWDPAQMVEKVDKGWYMVSFGHQGRHSNVAARNAAVDACYNLPRVDRLYEVVPGIWLRAPEIDDVFVHMSPIDFAQYYGDIAVPRPVPGGVQTERRRQIRP